MSKGQTDLGSGHSFRFLVGDTRSFPDTYGMVENHEDGTQMAVVGIIEAHSKPDGSPCEGSISLVRPLRPSVHEARRPIWEVQSLDPLTISPSVLCDCGVHGFIRQGRWSDT